MEIVRRAIDLTSADYIDGEHDRLIRESLESAGLFSPRQVYTVFDYCRVDNTLRTGLTTPPEEDVFYAFEADELSWEERDLNSLKDCASQYEEPGIAVFDRSKLFKPVVAYSNFGFSFKDKSKAGEALKGIFELIL